MKFTVDSFRAWPNKQVTLLGMSGVGKTYLSSLLRRHDWFHYSADYRIGKRYLDEPILDIIKQQAMRVPFLRDLLRRDWIDIKNNIKVNDLGPVLSFVGKLGDPARGGLELAEFSRRQAMYREAEIAAMRDVPEFERKGREIYGYEHFVNDVGGSLCELEEPSVIDLLVRHTLILYIRVTTAEEETTLIRRAQSDPKPLYFRPAFLAEQIARLSDRSETRDDRRGRPGRLHPLDIPASVPRPRTPLRSHRRPARLYRHLRRSGAGAR